jgi:hypothetical protein
MSNLVLEREVHVWSHKDNSLVPHMTTATTWKQLKTELASRGIQTKDTKGIVESTKVSLEVDEAVLPNEPFTLFLFVKKVKSGGYGDWKYNDLRKEASRRGLLKGLSSSSKEDMINLLYENDEGYNNVGVVDQPVSKEAEVSDTPPELVQSLDGEEFMELLVRNFNKKMEEIITQVFANATISVTINFAKPIVDTVKFGRNAEDMRKEALKLFDQLQ